MTGLIVQPVNRIDGPLKVSGHATYAAEYFDSRPPWYRRTAIHLVISAKREETRLRRLAQMIEQCP